MINVFNADPSAATKYEALIGALILAHERARGHRKALPVMAAKVSPTAHLHQQARDRRERIYKLVKARSGRGAISAAVIVRTTGVSRQIVNNDLQCLKKAGRIVARDYGQWEVSNV